MNRQLIFAVLLFIFCGNAVGEEPFDRAIGKAEWYDSQSDTWQRVVPKDPEQGRDGDTIGSVSVFAFAMYALVIAVIALLLALLWKMRFPNPERVQGRKQAAIGIASVELPFLGPELHGDAEAGFRAACAAGQWNRAVVWLYAWQLRCLDAAGRVRIMAGKTNRQYIRELSEDQPLSLILTETIAAFEGSYFGREIMSQQRVETLATKHTHLLAKMSAGES